MFYTSALYTEEPAKNFRILEAIVLTINVKSGLIATSLNFKTLKTIAKLYSPR